jgi:hypothetical protein
MPDNSYISISKVLNNLIKTYHLQTDLFRYDVFNSWEKYVGSELAKFCQPVKFEKGTLTLKVKNQLWLQELGNKRKELLNSIKTKTKEIKIDCIEFI